MTVLDYDPRPKGPSPWRWVPPLYVMQAVPNALAVSVFPTALKSLGFENLTITSWIPLVSLPWTLKLLWAPLVDLTSTKRRWVLGTQAAIAGLVLLSALSLIAGHVLVGTIAALALMAFASATHDIAADGLYLLSLEPRQQAAFAGVITTCFRLGRMACLGGLIFLAGVLMEKAHWAAPAAWLVVIALAALAYIAGLAYNAMALPGQGGDLARRAENRSALLARTFALLGAGVCAYVVLSAWVHIAGDAVARRAGVGAWALPRDGLTHWWAAALASTIALCPTVWLCMRMLRNSPIAMALSTYVRQPGFAAIFFFILTYRLGEAMVSAMASLYLQDPVTRGGAGRTIADIGSITGLWGVIGIILGGLAGGAVVSRVGLRRAFWPLALAMHLPNALYVYAAHLSHLGVAPSYGLLAAVTFVDQFGYGFGFAGYSIYLMHVAQRTAGGTYRTTHYAIGTGLGALTVLLATALSGILQSALGYFGFFVAVCGFTVPGMVALWLIPMDIDPTMSRDR